MNKSETLSVLQALDYLERAYAELLSDDARFCKRTNMTSSDTFDTPDGRFALVNREYGTDLAMFDHAQRTLMGLLDTRGYKISIR